MTKNMNRATMNTTYPVSDIKGLNNFKLATGRIMNQYRNGNRKALVNGMLDTVSNKARREMLKFHAFDAYTSGAWDDCTQEIALLLMEAKPYTDTHAKLSFDLHLLSNRRLYWVLVHRALKAIQKVYRLDGHKASMIVKDKDGNKVYNLQSVGLFRASADGAEKDYMLQITDESAKQYIDDINNRTVSSEYSKLLVSKLNKKTRRALKLYIMGVSTKRIQENHHINWSRALADMRKLCLVEKEHITTGIIRAMAK